MKVKTVLICTVSPALRLHLVHRKYAINMCWTKNNNKSVESCPSYILSKFYFLLAWHILGNNLWLVVLFFVIGGGEWSFFTVVLHLNNAFRQLNKYFIFKSVLSKLLHRIIFWMENGSWSFIFPYQPLVVIVLILSK